MFLWKEGFNVAEIIIISNLFILIGYKNVFLFIDNKWAVKFNAFFFLNSWRNLLVAQTKVDKKGNDQESIQSNSTSCLRHQMWYQVCFAKDVSTKGMFYKDHITITSTKSYLQVTKTYFDLSTVNSNIYRDRI